MNSLQQLSIFVLSLEIIFGTPVYIFFRNKMTKGAYDVKTGYSQSKVFKLTTINMLIMMSAYLPFLFALIGILNYQIPHEPVSMLLFLGFLITTGLIFYGCGIYITSIVLEAFTLPKLRNASGFKTQFIATHLFHGPTSHFLIYSGAIFSLFILALLEYILGSQHAVNNALVFLSLPVGLFYAFAQIYNNTYFYQLATSLISLIAFLVLVSLDHGESKLGTVGMYYIFFSFGLILTLIAFRVTRKLDQKAFKSWVKTVR